MWACRARHKVIVSSVSAGFAIAEILAESNPVADLLGSRPKLPAWSPYAAVGFSALAGAAFAARRGFDVIGIFGLAIAQGLGGLLLMSVLLQTGTPQVLTDGWYLLIVGVAATLGFFFAGLIARAVQAAVLLDALALGLLCALGTNAAQRSGLSPLPAVFIGVMTAVGGLILRDIMAGRAPEILRPGIFVAFAAVVGATLFVLLTELGASLAFAQMATLIVVAAIRWLSVHFGWATHEATDFSDRVWRIWGRKAPSAPEPEPMTQQFDRLDP